MELPELIIGGIHKDNRGQIQFNNDFNAEQVKRIYVIENIDYLFKRAWQGHRIERRWFAVIAGSFEIKLVKIDNWDHPSKTLDQSMYRLNSDSLDVLCIPGGYVSSIQALEDDSKLLVMADYSFGEIADEYRYSNDYFDS